ncbi:hypothetical protein F5884DRAFT_315757 [Xylogone sp. PMI_703]|nr:hypothetical protein F5884DRAFT_315757 [Xylogone sp. PMI_703]
MVWLTKFIHGCLYAGPLFLTLVRACPDYADLPSFRSINSSESSADATGLIKRYYTVQQTDGPSFSPGTWPDSTIPYCFETADAKAQLAKLVQSGWKLWQSAGVSYRINMGEYSACPDPGDGPVPPSKNYLLIQLNNQGKLVTSVGYQIYTSRSGPTMQFDPSPAVAMRDPVANMAHEIGHAWGFYHEHQRPSFWSRSQYANGKGATNQVNFDCTKLADYAAQVGELGLDGTSGDACHSYVAAKAKGFSALQYMPMDEEYTVQLDAGDYDWDSIMLYGSAIGGVVTNGVPANVYTRASDGKAIGYNKVPSPRDVERFMAMYSQNAPFPNTCLINQGCSPLKASFLRTKDKCKKII